MRKESRKFNDNGWTRIELFLNLLGMAGLSLVFKYAHGDSSNISSRNDVFALYLLGLMLGGFLLYSVIDFFCNFSKEREK